MNEPRANCLSSGTAADVCAQFPISAEAMALLREGMCPHEFLDSLIENGELVDAVQFLAHALPKREAVWWACRAARATVSAGATGQALRAAEAWAIDPSEERRLAAQESAEDAGYDTPAGCAAAAAAWSGGSLAPPGAPVVPPGPHLTAHGASAAVMLSAASAPAEAITSAYRALLADGQSIARGEENLPEPQPSAVPAAPLVSPRLPESTPSAPGLKQPVRWE
jgi:hypothetical protein